MRVRRIEEIEIVCSFIFFWKGVFREGKKMEEREGEEGEGGKRTRGYKYRESHMGIMCHVVELKTEKEIG